MKSERILVKVHGADDWRGDALRFRPGSGHADARGVELSSEYASVAEWRVVTSEDAPTHIYKDGHLRLIGTLEDENLDVLPPGYDMTVPVQEGFPDPSIVWFLQLLCAAGLGWFAAYLTH